ncbi:MAG: TolC family protein [Desulfotignum sp.]|nr:TolC family protein [Desulfobacteraceae bacterium]
MIDRKQGHPSGGGILTARKAILVFMVMGFLLLDQLCIPAFSGEAVTFTRALEIMISRNEAVLSAASEVEQKEYEAKATRGLNFPEVTLRGQFVRINESIDLDLNPVRDVILALHPAVPPAAVPAFQETVQEETFFKSQLNVTWPVYTGGRISAAQKAADAGIRESAAKLDLTKDSLISELVKYYYAVRLADQVCRIRKEVLDALDRHVFQARRLQEEGFIASTEVLHARVAQSQAEREVKASLRDLDLTKIALAGILAVENPVSPVSPLFLLQSVEQEASFIRQARSHHPAIDRIAAVRDRAGENLKAAKSERYPTVYLFGTRELYEKDLTVLDPAWSIGAGVNFTLFDGGARTNKVAAARSKENQAALMERKIARDLETLVSSRYQEMMNASEQYDSLQSSVALAKENIRARSRSFEEGLATSLDVVDAQLSLSEIRVERLLAAYHFDVALARLLEACGRGTEFPQYLAGNMMEVEH